MILFLDYINNFPQNLIQNCAALHTEHWICLQINDLLKRNCVIWTIFRQKKTHFILLFQNQKNLKAYFFAELSVKLIDCRLYKYLASKIPDCYIQLYECDTSLVYFFFPSVAKRLSPYTTCNWMIWSYQWGGGDGGWKGRSFTIQI